MRTLTTILRRFATRRVTLILAVVGVCAGVAVGALVCWPMDPAPYLRVDASARVTDRNGELIYVFLTPDDSWCFPVELSEVNPYLIDATLATEDQRFRSHVGVDPVAVLRATWSNVRALRIRSGASTLTMQLVKQGNQHSRTLSSKVMQAVEAIRLDWRVDKDTLLQTYLNRAPYGLNLIGCESASRRYFGKRARDLTLAEAALLAGLPKAPANYMPMEHPEAALQRRNAVLARMLDEGYINPQQHDAAVNASLGAAWHDFPALSPHLAQRLRADAEKQGKIVTTLDATVQRDAQRLLEGAVTAFKGSVTNGAVIVVDVARAEVLARVGSASFFDTPGGGQVDACLASRSPGSALKPFTYALAMQRNVLYPNEMLYDGMLDYGLYQPVNFDGNYRGLITASAALQRSLNVPAVAVLERVGVKPVYRLLKDLGMTTLTQPVDHYGLGLTIGNCGARLEEVAAAYCAIAALGKYRPLSAVNDGVPRDGTQCLDRGVCVALYDMMEQPLPLEFDPTYLPSVNDVSRVCWKTGTSTGLHDAWAFVFNAHYVVGVWLGNNDGRSSRSLVGARAALPLAGSVFRGLPRKTSPAWPTSAGDMKDVVACATTGLPVSPWCGKTKVTRIPRIQYVHRVCSVHQPQSRGELVATGSVERWPGTAKGFDLARVPDKQFVFVRARDAQESRADALRILSPADGAEFVLTGEAKGDKIQLESSGDAGEAIHWYMDGRYIAASKPDEPVYLSLMAGMHKLTAMNGAGEQDSVTFVVGKPAKSPWKR